MNENMEENDNDSEDGQTITDTSMSQESLTKDDVVSEKDELETLKGKSNSDRDKDVTQTSNISPEFRYEDVKYWDNFRPSSEKSTEKEISIEDLERWSKDRKYNYDNKIDFTVCDYNSKKESTMKRHMNTYHGGQNSCSL